MTKYTELKEKYKGKRIILHVASYLSPMKGTEFAIEAMGYVNKEFSNALLLIITSHGDYERSLELIKLAGNVGAKIEFVMGVKDETMPAYYSLAEVLLAPNLDENVHLPQLEAQSCGTPVVTLCGNEEVIHGKTGYIGIGIKNNREDVIKVLSMEVLTILWGKNGWVANHVMNTTNIRQFILDNFTWDKCIESYKRIIKEVTSDSSL